MKYELIMYDGVKTRKVLLSSDLRKLMNIRKDLKNENSKMCYFIDIKNIKTFKIA